MREYNIFLVNRLWLSKSGNLSVFFFLLFPIFLFAWTTPINISNTDSISNCPALYQDKRGWIHIVWEDRTPGNYDIYYTFYDGNVWADTLNVSHGYTCWRPDVAADTLNNIHVVWGDYDTGKIMWTMHDGNSWSTPVSLSDSVPYSCHGPELDISLITNYIHCVWHNLGAADIWYSYYNGTSWSIPENVSDDPDDSAWPDIAVDRMDRKHLVWTDYNTFDIFYSRNDSNSWSYPENISNLPGQSCDTRIEIDTYNYPRVVWEERYFGYHTYFSYFNGTDWINPVYVDSIDTHHPDIAVGKDNRIYIVYSYDYEIYYVVYEDTIQISPRIDISNTGHSLLPFICVDSLYVHVIWVDGSMDSSSPKKNMEIFYNYNLLSGLEEEEKININYSTVNFSKLCLSISKPERVLVEIYDITGRKRKTYKSTESNTHIEIPLDLSSGIYFFRMKTSNVIFNGKFILINQ
ncbi:T9SS type A sorting domain-containing protein [candidate division WOR-3 bacterium]|nr:T9SS type A sorting domain-containing protein [candidate division WOR-3 bacterium]